MAITTVNKLQTDAWKPVVGVLESAIGRLAAGRPAMNDCQIVFFEIATDGRLHVNVTHRYATKEVRGWAGPAVVESGFLHNRTFGDTTSRSQMIRHIQDMVFAARI